MDAYIGEASAALRQTVMDCLPVRVFWKDQGLRYLGCNLAFAKDAGFDSPEALIGKSDYELGWKELADDYQFVDHWVLESGKPSVGYERPSEAPDGHQGWLRASKYPLRDIAGDIIGIVGIYEEITALKQAEEAQQHLNRALKLLSSCSSAVVHAADEGLLLTEVCRLAVEVGGYRMAWVGFAEHDENKRVRPVAEFGFDDGYLEGVNITWADDEHGHGPTGTAIRSGATQVNQSFLINLNMAPWREQALKRNFQSSIALPLRISAEADACLTLYAEEPDAFAPDEVKLLEDMAGDLAYGIATLRTRAELAVRKQDLSQSLDSAVEALAAVVESRDPYTAGHQRRVAELCVSIAREMGMPAVRTQGLCLAAMIHDLGKIHIPAEILARPGRLNAIEFELIKSHPQVAYDILKDFPFPWPIAEIVVQHHERMDGSGYPKGLKGEAILLEARVLAVADVVESMASHRPYREALGMDASRAEILQQRGLKYDAAVVDACIAVLSEKGLPTPGAESSQPRKG